MSMCNIPCSSLTMHASTCIVNKDFVHIEMSCHDLVPWSEIECASVRVKFCRCVCLCRGGSRGRSSGAQPSLEPTSTLQQQSVHVAQNWHGTFFRGGGGAGGRVSPSRPSPAEHHQMNNSTSQTSTVSVLVSPRVT